MAAKGRESGKEKDREEFLFKGELSVKEIEMWEKKKGGRERGD